MSKIGRSSAAIAGTLRNRIQGGEIPVGEFLPTVRDLEASMEVSRETGRRALKLLEREGLISAESRKGYRVLAKVNDPDKGLPIAFVVTRPAGPGLWDQFRQMLMAGVQKAASDRGWSLLAVEAGDRPAREIVEQLCGCRACGIVLDTMNEELIDRVVRLQMPAVMMDAWDRQMRLDSVVQDGFQGALKAVEYLAGHDHKRIAWLGPIAESTQSHERFGGCAAGIAAAGLKIEPKLLLDTRRDQALEAARAMLSRADRPTGILALWHECVAAAMQACRERGLVPGRDVEVVGWTPEEQYDGPYRALFAGLPLPPTVVWSTTALTRMVIARLAERRANSKLPTALTKIPVKLIEGEK